MRKPQRLDGRRDLNERRAEAVWVIREQPNSKRMECGTGSNDGGQWRKEALFFGEGMAGDLHRRAPELKEAGLWEGKELGGYLGAACTKEASRTG